MSRAISVLVHGASKSGKSTFASTSPKPICYFDIEGGSRFLNINRVDWDPGKNAPPEPDGSWDTAVVTIRTYDDAIKAYTWLQSGKHPFNSLVVDSISELQQKLVDKVTGRRQAQTQDWGEILRSMMGLMRDFRDLCEHPKKPLASVVLVAMTKQGGDGLYQPHLQGQAAITIPYLVDVLAATYVASWTDDAGNQQRSYRTLIGPNNIYATGERVGGRLPSVIENATVPEMLDAVFGPVTT